MWQIIKAEIIYNRMLFISILGFVLAICVYEINLSETYGFMLLLLMFVFLQSWHVKRNREKREYQFMQLPVAARQVAAVRIGIIILIGLSMVVVYKIILFIVPPAPVPYHANPVTYLGLIVLGFSILFVMQDLLRESARRIGITQEKILVGFMIFFIGFAALGVLALKMVEAGRPLPISPKPVADFLVGRSPAHSGFGLLKFLAASILLASITIFTFGHRKSFLE